MSIAENYRGIQARIDAACRRAGRDPSEIRLVWVSKNNSRERVLEAAALGACIFGENRVQEALEKFPLTQAPGTPTAVGTVGHVDPQVTVTPELHLIGRLQKNKIRKILPLASAIHSIDSLELLEAVNRVAGELGLKRDVFLQVNTSREPQKGGFEPEELLGLARSLGTGFAASTTGENPPPAASTAGNNSPSASPHVRVIGLMTMGPADTVGGEPAALEETRRCFRQLAGLLGELRSLPVPPWPGLAFLSMGMTHDFEVAIEEGAHYLRIGTGLFRQ